MGKNLKPLYNERAENTLGRNQEMKEKEMLGYECIKEGMKEGRSKEWRKERRTERTNFIVASLVPTFLLCIQYN